MRALSSNWISRPFSFQTFSRTHSVDCYVADFISLDRSWNIDLLCDHFLLIDVSIIHVIPLSPFPEEDALFGFMISKVGFL